jgi:phosphomannomutase
MSQPLIVSASGIRGIVGAGLTPDVAARYGAAFGSFLRRSEGAKRHLLIGRDSRTSGALLSDAAAAGLRAVGWTVRDLGIVPTPTALLATADDAGAAGALVVTASHNPGQWNGLKLAGPDGRFLSPEAGLQVQRLYDGSPEYAEWSVLGDRHPAADAIANHVERILDLPWIDAEGIRARALRVVVDCVHGAGGLILPDLLKRLGCSVIGIGLEADGRFPRNPEPTVENLEELGQAVREADADLGLAVDPDVDRLSLVDGEGTPVGEDWTLALAVELVLMHGSGTVVTNLSSSMSIRDAATRAGQPFERSPVGEANVVQRMTEVGAVIGGEGNGGVILPALHMTRDAPLAAALVLQLLADRETSLRALLAGWPRYWIAKRRATRPEGSLSRILDGLKAAAPDGAVEDRRDGLHLAWEDDRWLHVRPSGTEPILRVYAEADAPETAERLASWAVQALSNLG